METKTTLTIRLSKEQLKTLREIALKEDRSLSSVIRRLIDYGTKANSKKVEGSFKL